MHSDRAKVLITLRAKAMPARAGSVLSIKESAPEAAAATKVLPTSAHCTAVLLSTRRDGVRARSAAAKITQTMSMAPSVKTPSSVAV